MHPVTSIQVIPLNFVETTVVKCTFELRLYPLLNLARVVILICSITLIFHMQVRKNNTVFQLSKTPTKGLTNLNLLVWSKYAFGSWLVRSKTSMLLWLSSVYMYVCQVPKPCSELQPPLHALRQPSGAQFCCSIQPCWYAWTKPTSTTESLSFLC